MSGSVRPRPYGVGPYGTGPYSRYGPVLYEVAGRSDLVFDATARTIVVLQVNARSDMVFNARALGVQRVFVPEARSDLVFNAWTEAWLNWATSAPCEPGAWAPADPCETGLWTLPASCITGSWTSIPR